MRDGAEAALRARLTPHLSTCGITRVADLTDLDRIGVPVFTAVRPASRNLVVSQGKAFDADTAWLGAVMEALELHAAETPPTLGAPRHDGAAWVPAKDWRTGEPVAVPLDAIDLDFTRPPSDQRFLRSSNGMAAHVDPDRAIRHALLEVIERHVLAGSRRRRHEIRRIVKGRPRRPSLRTLLERLAKLQIASTLWRLPPFNGFETVKVRMAAAYADAPPVFGAAAGENLEEAATRAILECVQSRATRLAGARDDLTAADYADASEYAFDNVRTGIQATMPWPATGVEPRTGCGADTIADRLAMAGFSRILVVNLPTPIPEIHVVKILVPGLLNVFARREHRAA